MGDIVRHIDDDMYTDIVHGLMPREEVLLALDHARNCQPCEEQLRERVAAFETRRAGNTPVRTPDGRWVLEEQAKTEDRPKPSRVWSRSWDRTPLFARWVVGGAMAAAVIAVVVTPLRRQEPQLPTHWLPASSELRDIRSAGGAGDEDLWRGIEAYESRDFETAVEILQGADVSGPYADIRDTYLSGALVMRGENAEALSLLDGLDLPTLPEPWRSHGLWVRYIALERAGHEAEARELLHELAKLEGEIGEFARKRRRELGID